MRSHPVLGPDGSGFWGVLATRNPLLLFRLSVVFLLRFAERRFLGLLFQDPPRRTRSDTGRPGLLGRIEDPALEDRVAQAPSIGMFSVRNP